jgi:hypothetical protein
MAYGEAVSIGYITDALRGRLDKSGDWKIKYGFDPYSDHSYRGYYSDLAFEPKNDVSALEMVLALESAIGSTYRGYKGGEFTMDKHSEVWIAHVGTSSGSNPITATLINYWLED